MVHLGPPPLRLKPSMRIVPLRLLVGVLLPIDKRDFVTPLQQSAHRFPVGAREHEGLIPDSVVQTVRVQ
jgi:hypothetical protein